MVSDSTVTEVADGVPDEDTHKKEIEQYLKMREKNIRKCHFNYRRRS